MNSESVAGILGAIVASVVLVAAIVYGPIGQIGKPARQPARSNQRRRSAGSGRARPAGAGGAGGAEVSLQRPPLAQRPDRSYLVSNGDVDAS